LADAKNGAAGGDQSAHEAKTIAMVITEADTFYGVTADTLTLF
jgi:hypothetical protein